jgi:hypothetical protein
MLLQDTWLGSTSLSYSLYCWGLHGTCHQSGNMTWHRNPIPSHLIRPRLLFHLFFFQITHRSRFRSACIFAASTDPSTFRTMQLNLWTKFLRSSFIVTAKWKVSPAETTKSHCFKPRFFYFTFISVVSAIAANRHLILTTDQEKFGEARTQLAYVHRALLVKNGKRDAKTYLWKAAWLPDECIIVIRKNNGA